MAFLGIDLGTSAVKVLVLGAEGQALGSGRADYPLLTPQPGWAEGDPQAWWTATVAATRAALAAVEDVEIDAIGLAGQMHGVVPVGAEGEPVRPAPLWADGRATAALARYDALPPALRAALANPIVPGMMGPLLLWLRDHEAASYAATRWALSPKDWLRLRLTGTSAGDHSDASATLLYDLAADGWADGVIDALGLRRSLLPDLLPASAQAGRLSRAAAAHLGLPDGIPVAAGGGDTPCAALGSGLLTAGPIQITLGTGAQIVRLVDAPHADPTGRTHLYRTVAGAGWYRMAAVQNGGLALDWVRRTLGATWEDLYASAASIPPGAGGVVFTPYLATERTVAASAAGGAWTGLHLNHTRAHLLRAALEGVARVIRAALDDLLAVSPPVDLPLRLAGGGSIHPAWRQVLAEALGHPLHAVDVPDASARGAAILAGMAVGHWTDAPPLADSDV